ncbi:MAG: Prolyl oligopeptidase family protein [Planctomycetaceae bacterium]|nr:Prolyl oligopeptidase family protein [Planctomycetaceae bacterium]
MIDAWKILIAACFVLHLAANDIVAQQKLDNNHQDLTYFLDNDGQRNSIKNQQDWKLRRAKIQQGLQAVLGEFPTPQPRVPLDIQIIETTKVGDVTRQKLTYQSDTTDRVSAYLLFPPKSERKVPAILCLHQTVRIGKGEPAGLGGDPSLQYALHLAARGYVTLAPDYPSFGDHEYDFAPRHGYSSGTMKAVWDNVRAVDLLQSLPEVDSEQIGCIGHSLGGHNAMFTAAFEPRLKVIVSSCGFTRFHRDDVPSWTGRTYMPRIAERYQNDPDKLPFDFPEIIGLFAPRPFLACAAVHDDDFNIQGVRESLAAASSIYQLLGHPKNLVGYYPAAGHSFPKDARETAYQFFEEHLGKPNAVK